MKTFMSAAVMAALASAELMADHFEFSSFAAKYNKTYGSVEEYQFRMEQFLNTRAFIEEINNSQNSQHKAGHNKFSDWTEAEFKSILNKRKQQTLPSHIEMKVPQVESNPESVDWRTSGNVTPVKDQGDCGSCWTFSTTGALESAYSIDTGKLVEMSEQLLMDCARNESNYSCEGGEIYWAYQWLYENKMMTEADYPYLGTDQTTCSYDESKGLFEVERYYSASNLGQDGDRVNIQAALALKPCNVAVAAGNDYFRNYESGILSAAECPTDMDHSILAVGYGIEDGTNFIIVKNSWGPEWGENGYIRMELTEHGIGICGVNQQVIYP